MSGLRSTFAPNLLRRGGIFSLNCDELPPPCLPLYLEQKVASSQLSQLKSRRKTMSNIDITRICKDEDCHNSLNMIELSNADMENILGGRVQRRRWDKNGTLRREVIRD